MPSRIRPTFDCLLKNMIKSCMGQKPLSCISATIHARTQTPVKVTNKYVKSSCIMSYQGIITQKNQTVDDLVCCV